MRFCEQLTDMYVTFENDFAIFHEILKIMFVGYCTHVEKEEMKRENWWVWLPGVWSANSVILCVCWSTFPPGVSQETTPVTSVSTESGRMAMHVRVRAEPGNTSGGGASSTFAMGTAKQTMI